jgi:hypothetical protein
VSSSSLLIGLPEALTAALAPAPPLSDIAPFSTLEASNSALVLFFLAATRLNSGRILVAIVPTKPSPLL